MTLDELNAIVKDNEDTKCCEGEVCSAGDDDPDTDLEEDLSEALDLLEKMLLMVESMKIRRRRIVRVPDGMMELMEEVGEFLDQWPESD